MRVQFRNKVALEITDRVSSALFARPIDLKATLAIHATVGPHKETAIHVPSLIHYWNRFLESTN
jgi:hypothetical protein